MFRHTLGQLNWRCQAEDDALREVRAELYHRSRSWALDTVGSSSPGFNMQNLRWILAILDDFGFGWGRFGCLGLSWPILAYLDSGAQGFLQPPVPQDQASGAASASLAGAQMS